MKIDHLTNSNLQNGKNFMWKKLLGLILSVLIFFPTPAWAFDFNNLINSFNSVDLNKVVDGINRTDLDQIVNELKKLDINQAVNELKQVNFSKVINDINSFNLNKYLENSISAGFKQNYRTISTDLDNVGILVRQLPTLSYENGQKTLKEVDSKLQVIQTQAEQNAKFFSEFAKSLNATRQKNLDQLNKTFPQPEYLKQTVKETNDLIVLCNRVNFFYDNLKNRLIAAKDKSSNVKAYAEDLLSFINEDTLAEVKALDEFITNLTKDLPSVS